MPSEAETGFVLVRKVAEVMYPPGPILPNPDHIGVILGPATARCLARLDGGAIDLRSAFGCENFREQVHCPSYGFVVEQTILAVSFFPVSCRTDCSRCVHFILIIPNGSGVSIEKYTIWLKLIVESGLCNKY